jgi:hypothetical protein
VCFVPQVSSILCYINCLHIIPNPKGTRSFLNYHIYQNKTPPPPQETYLLRKVYFIYLIQLLQMDMWKKINISKYTIYWVSSCLCNLEVTILSPVQGTENKVCVLVNMFHLWLLKVQELRMSYESQSILMTEFNVCPVCKKRFGNQRYDSAYTLLQNIFSLFWVSYF